MRTLSIFSIGAVLALNSAVLADPAMESFKIAKECSQYSGETPSFCTVTESNVAAIPTGTKILYYGPVTSNPLFGSSAVVLAVGPGDSAVGHCITYDSAKPPLGLCAFHAGSGSLAGFQAIAKVSVERSKFGIGTAGTCLAPRSNTVSEVRASHFRLRLGSPDHARECGGNRRANRPLRY